MADLRHTNHEDGDLRVQGALGVTDVNAWFVREVLPLEPLLMNYLRRQWPNQSEIEDLRQDIYIRVHLAGRQQIPTQTKPFVFRIAHDLLVDRIRHEQVVPIEAVADFDELDIAIEAPPPDRTVIARDELRRLQAALDKLPPRAREAVMLGRIEGLSGREIAQRMGIGTATVSVHLTNGIHALADILYGEPHTQDRKHD
jgi:RNA polymerase sigma factor (sigma-70 family)